MTSVRHRRGAAPLAGRALQQSHTLATTYSGCSGAPKQQAIARRGELVRPNFGCRERNTSCTATVHESILIGHVPHFGAAPRASSCHPDVSRPSGCATTAEQSGSTVRPDGG